MNATLRAFAEIYRQSAAGRRGAARDYTLDWEKFLRLSSVDDGDARELAVQDLLAAERSSAGRFVIDRHPRTATAQRLRLKQTGGEDWLFESLGLVSPTGERRRLAAIFTAAAALPMRAEHADAWKHWCEGLAHRASAGLPVSPFRRDDEPGNASLITALAGVLNWQSEALVRYASEAICHDSKALENLRPRLIAALAEITGRSDVSLEDFGISNTPRPVLFHGPLILELPGGRIDFGLLAGPLALCATDIERATSLVTTAPLCLTVENEAVFRELAKRATGNLLVRTSFPGAATRLLFNRLPVGLRCAHFGDSDPAGFDILRDLREKTGRGIHPLMMRFRPQPGAGALTDDDRKTISRLLTSTAIRDVHGELQTILEAGTKGRFEQESIPIDDVVAAISQGPA